MLNRGRGAHDGRNDGFRWQPDARSVTDRTAGNLEAVVADRVDLQGFGSSTASGRRHVSVARITPGTPLICADFSFFGIGPTNASTQLFGPVMVECRTLPKLLGLGST
jgi:hypothetical protein